jgi:hypothetical protein
MISLLALTQVTPPSGGSDPQWWTVAAGIIAIPAAILGIFYTFSLMKKTRLETRKFELEVKEKEASLTAAVESSSSAELTKLVARPLIEGRRVQEIILRFVILFLVLQIWRIIERVFDAVAGGFRFAIAALADQSDVLSLVLYIIFMAIQELPTVGYYLVLIGLGGPILIDSLRYLGITPPKMLAALERPTRSTYVLLGIVVLVVAVLGRATPLY